MVEPAQLCIADGLLVRLSCELWVQGERIEAATEADALEYVHGQGQIAPGLERALLGRAVGAELELELPPAEAFGELDPARIEYLPLAAFPPGAALEIGQQFGAYDEQGREVALWITELDGERVRVNGNHPLAGQTVRFRVRVLEVRRAP